MAKEQSRTAQIAPEIQRRRGEEEAKFKAEEECIAAEIRNKKAEFTGQQADEETAERQRIEWEAAAK